MSNSIIAINLVVLNGDKYIRHCLDAILAQTFNRSKIEVNILDNGSTDKTLAIIEDYVPKFEGYAKFNFIKSSFNYGMWGGQEELLRQAQSPYLIVLSVDVIMAPEFISKAVENLDQNLTTGAIQPKVYQFSLNDVDLKNRMVIDTCGFKIFRSRKVINIGHGETDVGQYNLPAEIFGVEGAVPIFRKEALMSIEVKGEIADHDLFWYGEDLDVAWRLRLAGWSQFYAPEIIAWHDRQTTKRIKKNFKDFLAIRQAIPLRKRRLEWRNIRCTLIKNDYIINLLKDALYILPREAAMTLYLMLFEPKVLLEIPTLIRLLPRMIQKRKAILSKSKLTPREVHRFFA